MSSMKSATNVFFFKKKEYRVIIITAPKSIYFTRHETYIANFLINESLQPSMIDLSLRHGTRESRV